MPFLIADEVGVSEGAVIETVTKAVQVDFFNAEIFKSKNVLTSVGIQERFFKATERRKEIAYDATPVSYTHLDVYKRQVFVSESV